MTVMADGQAHQEQTSPPTEPVSADAVPARAGSLPDAGGGRKRRRRMGDATTSALWTVGLLVGMTVLAEIGSRADLWNASTFPAPSTTIAGVGGLLQDPQFWNDAGRTAMEVGVAMVAGAFLGLLTGLLFWKLPLVGRVFEPYLVSFYAVPLVLFYPVMIVLVGINAWSVIVLATIMAAIPMALNTAVGLNSIRPVYLTLARSLTATPSQLLFQIALPAAAPFIMAGLRLGVVYALIGSIAMEFTTAQAGLGYRIRYLYEIFDNQQMHSYILVVLLLSILLTTLLALLERLTVRGRTT